MSSTWSNPRFSGGIRAIRGGKKEKEEESFRGPEAAESASQNQKSVTVKKRGEPDTVRKREG